MDRPEPASPAADTSLATSPPTVQRWLLGLLCVSGAIYCAFLLIDRAAVINLDSAMYMDGARKLLAGGLPYIDFVDINPPLAIYLHTPAVWLAQLTGFELTNTYLLLILTATVASAVTGYRLLAAADPSARYRAALISTAPALVLLFMATNTDLGQRSHLFVLALFPYLTVRLLRAQGSLPTLKPYICVLIGLAMGLALCLKPLHYALMLAPAELYLLYRYRSFKQIFTAETVVILFVIAGYGIHFLLLPETVRVTFFDTYLPLIVESYDAFAATPQKLLLQAATHLLAPLIVVIAASWLMRNDSKRQYADLSITFAIIGIMAALLFVGQAKGWAYHAIPVWFASLVCGFALTGRVLASGNFPRLQKFIGATPVLILLTLSIIATSVSIKDSTQSAKRFLRSYKAWLIDTYTEPEDSVYIMSTSVDATYPLMLLANRQTATRFPFLFPIPMLYDGAEETPASAYGYRIDPARAELETDFLTTLNADLQRDLPRMMFIEAYPQCLFCPIGFYLPDYLEAHAELLPVLNEYTEFARTHRFRVYYLGEPPELEVSEEDSEQGAE